MVVSAVEVRRQLLRRRAAAELRLGAPCEDDRTDDAAERDDLDHGGLRTRAVRRRNRAGVANARARRKLRRRDADETRRYSGEQFDGRITGAKNADHIGHYFIPFSAKSHAAKYYPDEYGVYGDAFRVIVVNVRGHTVVIYIDSARLPADQFTTFLDQAALILASLRFPT